LPLELIVEHFHIIAVQLSDNQFRLRRIVAAVVMMPGLVVMREFDGRKSQTLTDRIEILLQVFVSTNEIKYVRIVFVREAM
jgi:hypothetical protein